MMGGLKQKESLLLLHADSMRVTGGCNAEILNRLNFFHLRFELL